MFRWFRPQPSGDLRLTARDAESCILSIIDPTPGEIELASKLLREARDKAWCSEAEGIATRGKTELLLKSPVHTVGATLFSHPLGRPLLTVASEGGRVTVVFDSEDSASTDVPEDPQLPATVDDKKAELEQADQATTVDRPRGGRQRGDCPESLASEVLMANCSPRQREQWLEHGWLTCQGGLSGHTYRLAHRKRHLGRLQSTVAVDLDERGPVGRDGMGHAHHRDNLGPVEVFASDWMLPPPEEVLAIMLVLQHREHWFRNPDGMPFARDMVFAQPFPERQARDEVEHEAIVVFEGALRAIMGGNIFAAEKAVRLAGRQARARNRQRARVRLKSSGVRKYKRPYN